MASVIECVFRNEPNRLQAELAKGGDPNERDSDERTPLIHAAIDNQIDCATLLLMSGALVNAQDDIGNSALHFAAQEGHSEMASVLINHGAIVDIPDKHGNTPLWRAVFNSRGEGGLIKLLLSAGADKNHHNARGKTPFDLASTIANYDVTSFFAGDESAHGNRKE